MKAILRFTLFDLRCWWRNGEQLLLMLILPAFAIAAGPRLIEVAGIDRGTYVDGVVLIAFFATAFTGQSILTAFDRRSNALLVVGAGALGRRGFIAARILAVLVTCVVQAVLLWPLSAVFGMSSEAYPLHTAIALFGIPAFTTAGLLMAGLLRAELVLAFANLLFVMGAAVGGAFNELTWSPLGAVRALQSGTEVPTTCLTLGIWTTLAALAAQRTFKWVD